MNLSFRFGTVLIGLGILLLGLHLQKGREGFQDPSVRPPEPLIAVDDLKILLAKDSELRSKMNLIVNTKTASDVLFLKQLSSDMMTNLNIIFKEAMQYINSVYDVGKIFATLNETGQFTLRQMIYTTSDQVNMLYSIYFTIPSNVISTDSIILSDSASMNTVSNPSVIAESTKQVTSILSTLPSPASKLNTYLTNIMNMIPKLTTDSAKSDYDLFMMNLKNYFTTMDTQQANMTANISDLTSAMKRGSVDASQLATANSNKVSFFNTSVSSLQSIITALQSANLPSPDIANALTDLNTHLTTMQAGLTAAKSQLTTESFVSNMNPYSSLQSREFALGKKAYVDEVFAGMKF